MGISPLIHILNISADFSTHGIHGGNDDANHGGGGDANRLLMRC